MEYSQLVLILTLALSGDPSSHHPGRDVDTRPGGRPEVRLGTGEDAARSQARPRPRATDRERLATGLVFGVAGSPRAR
jgi:hypothetical protein